MVTGSQIDIKLSRALSCSSPSDVSTHQEGIKARKRVCAGSGGRAGRVGTGVQNVLHDDWHHHFCCELLRWLVCKVELKNKSRFFMWRRCFRLLTAALDQRSRRRPLHDLQRGRVGAVLPKQRTDAAASRADGFAFQLVQTEATLLCEGSQAAAGASGWKSRLGISKRVKEGDSCTHTGGLDRAEDFHQKGDTIISVSIILVTQDKGLYLLLWVSSITELNLLLFLYYYDFCGVQHTSRLHLSTCLIPSGKSGMSGIRRNQIDLFSRLGPLRLKKKSDFFLSCFQEVIKP